MRQFVTSRLIYRTVRSIVGPTLKSLGFRRTPRTQAAWEREITAGRLALRCSVSSYGDAASAGNVLDVHLWCSGETPVQIRHLCLSRCLLQAELDELREIQALVNARRPMTELTAAWMAEDSELGRRTRVRYEPPLRLCYTEGRYVGFDFYSEEDILTFAAFLRRRCPAALDRFASDACPPSIFEPVALFG
jgi:hypothetical protein